MPTIDTETQHMTVRVSPDTPGHLEVTIFRKAGVPAQLLQLILNDGWRRRVGSRRHLADDEAVQIRLDRGDAMILLSLLQQVAYDLPMLPTDNVITVGREE